MGRTIIRDAQGDRFEVSGAVAADDGVGIGKSLRELGIADLDIRVQPPTALPGLLESSDVCISFTGAAAEVANLPVVLDASRPLILGTTGFDPAQMEWVLGALNSGRIASVMTSNFSVGANVLFAMAAALKGLPPEFDISILEMHHAGKVDAPSGTAKTIADIIVRTRGYSRTVYGRSGSSKRTREELEVGSFRGGGMAGEHDIFAFGPHEMLKFEHMAFSRSAFAQGALLAATWITAQKREPRQYAMLDVLGLDL
jgi:4-hydroxy-tetrahydrodipicolinate reductase